MAVRSRVLELTLATGWYPEIVCPAESSRRGAARRRAPPRVCRPEPGRRLPGFWPFPTRSTPKAPTTSLPTASATPPSTRLRPLWAQGRAGT